MMPIQRESRSDEVIVNPRRPQEVWGKSLIDKHLSLEETR